MPSPIMRLSVAATMTVPAPARLDSVADDERGGSAQPLARDLEHTGIRFAGDQRIDTGSRAERCDDRAAAGPETFRSGKRGVRVAGDEHRTCSHGERRQSQLVV